MVEGGVRVRVRARIRVGDRVGSSSEALDACGVRVRDRVRIRVRVRVRVRVKVTNISPNWVGSALHISPHSRMPSWSLALPFRARYMAKASPTAPLNAPHRLTNMSFHPIA